MVALAGRRRYWRYRVLVSYLQDPCHVTRQTPIFTRRHRAPTADEAPASCCTAPDNGVVWRPPTIHVRSCLKNNIRTVSGGDR